MIIGCGRVTYGTQNYMHDGLFITGTCSVAGVPSSCQYYRIEAVAFRFAWRVDQISKY